MLDIKRAGHSTLTTPDIERTLDHFTRIVGLSVAAREKNRVILATKSGLESIVLERGSAGDAPRLSLQTTPGSDPGEVVSRLQKAGVKSERQSDITPGIKEAVVFTDPKRHRDPEIFSDFEDLRRATTMVLNWRHAAQARPHRLYLPRRAEHREILLRCARLPRLRLARRFLRLRLRCSRDHHTVSISARSKDRDPSYRFRSARLDRHQKRASDFLALQRAMSISPGDRCATLSGTISRSITRTRMAW